MRGNYTKEKELIKSILNVGCREMLNEQNVISCFNKLEIFSNELYRHSVNVSVLSVILGLYAIKDMGEIKDLFVSGLLHDYGKLFVSKEILNKCDGLTMQERIAIEAHTTLGYKYLKHEQCFNDKILLGILEHHERMDGTGYGYRRSEKDISEFAKIIMIADVYDAMISDRVYRSKIDRGIVYEYLFSNAGNHFSSEYIKCFINNTLSLDLDYVIRVAEDDIFSDNSNNTLNQAYR